MTSADVQSRARQPGVLWRRILFLTAVVITVAALMAMMVATLSPGGIDAFDALILALFAVTLPFTAVGFWNAVIGFLVARLARDPVAATCPSAARTWSHPKTHAIESRVALVLCVRNEDVDGVFGRLGAMLDELIRAGSADQFAAFVLSDTDDRAIAAEEELAFQRVRAIYDGRFEVHYRRRSDNRAYKAGNIEDFAVAHRDRFDHMLVLDADSYMSADAIHRLVATMEADPSIGILQSLVVGLPTVSPFARIFQFGMRFGMRMFTLGSAWWQADCGPYWGHNAVIRVAPFVDHCRLPKLDGSGPLSGWVLSHDQVEAVLMRRAGYQVRVVPVEGESFEENPPSLIEFVRRELRWCHGNTQYLRLLATPGLAFVSRIQLVLAILMYFGGAAWMAMMIVVAVGVAASGGAMPMFDAGIGMVLLATILAMTFAPKIATTAEIVLRPTERRRFGGAHRVVSAILVEIVFTALVAPVVALSVFLFLAGLPFGRQMKWAAQQRDARLVPLRDSARRLWPHAAVGLAFVAAYASVSIEAALLGLPIAVGLVLSVPLTTLSSSTSLGRRLVRMRAFAVPEEAAPPATLRPLALEALVVQPGALHSGAGQPAAVASDIATDSARP